MIKLNKKLILELNAKLLLLLVCIDFIRGFMHTFLNDFAARNIAQISPNPDALYLLGVFGISNFVTSFIFLLIYIKARHLSPHILLVVSMGYAVGIVGVRFSEVTMQSPFNGQYMMFVYLTASLVLPLLYFISQGTRKTTRKNNNQTH